MALSPDARPDDIGAFRRQLHAHPELSASEHGTARRVADRLEALRDLWPDAAPRVVTGLGTMGTGICAVFEGSKAGPTVLLRCELDGLPIEERNDFAHRSVTPGVSHKCGHDGHMATLVAVAERLCEQPLESGRTLLLFQPAEETGAGAAAVLEDPRFSALGAPDHVYAFHNVPRHPLGTVLLRRGTFAQASVGFIVRFAGRTSHSSYPEHGLNPSAAVTALVNAVNGLGETAAGWAEAPVLGTVTWAHIGSPLTGSNFGIAPGEGCVTGVLRAQKTADLEAARQRVAELADRLASEAGLGRSLDWHEAFAATESTDEAVAVVRRAAGRAGLPVVEPVEPFRWSEDFGRFTQRFPGAFFGLGSGLEQPQLHDGRYDYPDDLIAPGARLYRAIIDEHLASPDG